MLLNSLSVNQAPKLEICFKVKFKDVSRYYLQLKFLKFVLSVKRALSLYYKFSCWSS